MSGHEDFFAWGGNLIGKARKLENRKIYSYWRGGKNCSFKVSFQIDSTTWVQLSEGVLLDHQYTNENVNYYIYIDNNKKYCP